jgi:hypothetical protein
MHFVDCSRKLRNAVITEESLDKLHTLPFAMKIFIQLVTLTNDLPNDVGRK